VTSHDKPLTDREQSVIELYQSGKTLRKIAAAVGISYQTVHTLLRKPHVRAALNDHASNTIQRVLERASRDLPEMLTLEAEIARMATDPKADAVRLKAIQGRIARHVALVTPSHAEPEATGDQDEAVLAGLERIKATRPDLLAAARLKADE
jgi:transposase